MKKWGAVVAVVAVVFAVAGCGSGSGSAGPAKTVEITAKDMAFGPKELVLEKGATVKLLLKNEDSLLHDLSVDKIAVKAEKGHDDGHDMGAKKPDLHVSADVGKTGEVTFTPTATGKYEFYCTVPGHKDAGMLGTLIVK